MKLRDREIRQLTGNEPIGKTKMDADTFLSTIIFPVITLLIIIIIKIIRNRINGKDELDGFL